MSIQPEQSVLTKKFVWYWQSNMSHQSTEEVPKWERYSDLENELIERAYRNGERKIEISRYLIDFEHRTQISQAGQHKECPIKRLELESEIKHLRPERFANLEKLHTRSFNKYEPEKWAWCYFGDRWCAEHYDIWQRRNWHFTLMFIADGILEEAAKLGQYDEGQLISDELQRVANESEDEIRNCCARLYTAETFLYRLVNETLRNQDMSKIRTLGGFVRLLMEFIYYEYGNRKVDTVYRGMNLTEEEIEEYRQAALQQKKQELQWLGFTSTSRNRQMAEQFGNVLFVLDISHIRYKVDMSDLSHYPEEQEVLLFAGIPFEVVKVEPDDQGKNVIYLKMTGID